MICPAGKKLSLYGAYGSIKISSSPKIFFYDFMVAPLPPIPIMNGLGVFVYAQFASPSEVGNY